MVRGISKRWIVIAASSIISAGCASAHRNPVLDKFPAGISGHTSVLYYDVTGNTVEEIRADMRRLGPKVGGGSYFAEARSPMRWNWRFDRTGSSYCSISDVTVSVNSEITLPRWTPPDNADPDLVDEWNRFLAALETHEAGHKDISAKAGRAIIARLRGFSDLCSNINTRASELARSIVDRAVVEQSDYDFTTRHGLTQGASFGIRRAQPRPSPSRE